jgi:hypothetical protein
MLDRNTVKAGRASGNRVTLDPILFDAAASNATIRDEPEQRRGADDL